MSDETQLHRSTAKPLRVALRALDSLSGPVKMAVAAVPVLAMLVNSMLLKLVQLRGHTGA